MCTPSWRVFILPCASPCAPPCAPPCATVADVFCFCGHLVQGVGLPWFCLVPALCNTEIVPLAFLASPNRPKLQQIEPLVCTSSRANGRTRRAQAPAQGKSTGVLPCAPCAGWDLPNLVHLGFSSFGLVHRLVHLVHHFFLIHFFSIQYSSKNHIFYRRLRRGEAPPPETLLEDLCI